MSLYPFLNSLLVFLGYTTTLNQIKFVDMMSGIIVLASILLLVLAVMCIGCSHPEVGIIFGIIGVFLFVGTMTLVVPFINGWHDSLESQRPFTTYPGYSYNTSDYQPIASLESENRYSESGSGTFSSAFTIGRGSMTSNGVTTEYYTFYKVLGDDEYEAGKIPKDGVIIKEDGDAKPQVEIITQHVVNEKKIYLDTNQTVYGGESSAVIKTYIHVPKGTVVKEYKL